MWNKTLTFIISLTLSSILLEFPLLALADPQENSPEKTIKLYLKETEAKDAFNLLSKASGQNLVVNNQLSGQVNMKLQNINFEDALNALCLAIGATYEKVGSVYVVSQPTDEKPMPFLPNNPVSAHSAKDPGQRQVTINIKNGDLATILQQMANQASVEMVIFGRVTGQVTARLQSISFEDALKTILAGSKLSYVRQGDRFLVGEPSSTNGMVQQLSKSEIIELNHITTKQFLGTLPPEIDASQIKPLEGRNGIIVTGVETAITKLQGYAQKVDIPQPQVALEINIVELSKDGKDQLTLLAPQITWQFVKKVNVMQFSLINNTISSLVNDGKATIRSRPSISTISGTKAKVDISDDINFELTTAVGTGAGTTITSNLQTIKAGTTMEVTPTVGKDGLIHTDLDIEVSGVSSFTAGPNGTQIPNVRRRHASTSVNVVDGETIMIGGLSENEEHYSYQKVPYIGKIPLLGELAASHNNSKSKSELVIFITPHLIESKSVASKEAVTVLPNPLPPIVKRSKHHQGTGP